MNKVTRVINKIQRIFAGKNQERPSLQKKFSEIYHENLFGGKVSRSGEGSNLEQTDEIRKWLPEILKRYETRRFLDAPCGDLYWMRYIDFGETGYIGVDIVGDLIEKNKDQFGAEGKVFHCANLAADVLPKADMIFCRDCLVHLSFEDAFNVLRRFKETGAAFLVATTFVNRDENLDLYDENGEDRIWRVLNLQLAPFNFPDPIELFEEKCPEGGGAYADKSLGVWRLQELDLISQGTEL
jgi:hypothetical protein